MAIASTEQIRAAIPFESRFRLNTSSSSLKSVAGSGFLFFPSGKNIDLTSYQILQKRNVSRPDIDSFTVLDSRCKINPSAAVIEQKARFGHMAHPERNETDRSVNLFDDQIIVLESAMFFERGWNSPSEILKPCFREHDSTVRIYGVILENRGKMNRVSDHCRKRVSRFDSFSEKNRSFPRVMIDFQKDYGIQESRRKEYGYDKGKRAQDDSFPERRYFSSPSFESRRRLLNDRSLRLPATRSLPTSERRLPGNIFPRPDAEEPTSR